MDNKAFDAIIKKQLEGLETPFSNEHWEMMSTRLDQEFGIDITSEADAVFDQNVKASLEGMTIPAASDSWELLQNKIAEDAALRRKVIFVKAAELMILFLIVFTIFNLNLLDPILNYNNEVNQVSNTTTSQSMHTQANLIAPNNKVNSASQEDANEIQESRIETIKVLENQEADPTVEQVPSEAPTTEGVIYASANHIKVINGQSYWSQSQKTHYDTHVLAQTDLSSVIANTANQQSTLNTIMTPATVDVASREVRLLESATPLASINSEIVYKKAQRTGDILLFDKDRLNTAIVVAQDNDNKMWLNTFASADLNLINSPFDFVYRTPSYLSDDLGGSFGATVSVEKGKFEFETGIVYSHKSYEPRINEEIVGDFRNGYQKTSLNNISFDMLSVPLSAKLHFKSTKNWSFYMMLGASLNFVTNSDFQIAEETTAGLDGIASDFNIASRLGQKSFEKGIFDGGSLDANTYLCGVVGAGIQRRVSDGISLYLQPNYSYHTMGASVGPNNDRIHSLSLQVGAKIALN